MSPSIEIDDEVMDALKRHAEPFVDTPNDVLRRLVLSEQDGDQLDVKAGNLTTTRANAAAAGSRRHSSRTERKTRAGGAGKRAAKRKRAPSDALLPEEAYELPILRVLEEADGRLPTREAVAAVGKIVANDLTPVDHEVLDNGRERWEMRVQFTRLRLVERGLMKENSPRGVWEISDVGREHLKGQAVSA